MRFRKLETINNEVLGNLVLNFCNEEGQPVDTIILAGENGVGKSYILNLLYEFSNLNLSDRNRDEQRKFEIVLSDDDLKSIKSDPNLTQYFHKQIDDNCLSINIDYNVIGNWNQIKIYAVESATKMTVEMPSHLFSNPSPRRIIKSIFSDVAINFTPKAIATVTSKNIDTIQNQSVKSSKELATEITQLLIDVQSLDALDFTEWARNNLGKEIIESRIDTRLKRFTEAFHYIFPTKRYKRIGNKENKKEVVFEDQGRETSIEQLSSGEKQIVFRGGFLLRDKESTKGATVLIDEPEISMHPNWQLKILNYFKRLFCDASGNQSSQIIIATHSPFIIHNSNRSEDKIIILSKAKDGQVVVAKRPRYYSWTPEKDIQDAFNISHALVQDKITVFVEGETDEHYCKTCMTLYGMDKSKIDFKWIGRLNEKGNPENTGDPALNQARVFFLANPDVIKNEVILLYDSDTNVKEESSERLHVRRMPLNGENKLYQIGIENLLMLPEDFIASDYIKERTKIDKYGVESTIRELDKMKLCRQICNDSDTKTKNKTLSKIGTLIEELLKKTIDSSG